MSTVTDNRSVLMDLANNFFIYFPLVFIIFGFIGFIGNLFTYLQKELRSNPCCIYSLCGSIVDIITLSVNNFPQYLTFRHGISIPWGVSSVSCKINLFLLVFLPHLSINFLLTTIFDRYACTCQLGSPIRRLNNLKMVPWLICFTIITSILASSYTLILFSQIFPGWCDSTQPTTTGILYCILIGLLHPALMILFVFLTHRNVKQSRQRVGNNGMNNHQRTRNQLFIMVCAQILVTSFLSLQWIITYTYTLVTVNYRRTMEQQEQVFFFISLTNNLFYLNYVKAFYLALCTSRLFRTTLQKGLHRLLKLRVGMIETRITQSVRTQAKTQQ